MEPAFRIRDIFADPDLRIRSTGLWIRTLLFFQWGFQDANKKKNFFPRVFGLLLVTFTPVFKDEIPKV
jgi:hypothetical protein